MVKWAEQQAEQNPTKQVAGEARGSGLERGMVHEQAQECTAQAPGPTFLLSVPGAAPGHCDHQQHYSSAAAILTRAVPAAAATAGALLCTTAAGLTCRMPPTMSAASTAASACLILAACP